MVAILNQVRNPSEQRTLSDDTGHTPMKPALGPRRIREKLLLSLRELQLYTAKGTHVGHGVGMEALDLHLLIKSYL